jgi:DNA-3-methyladenine glycosylase
VAPELIGCLLVKREAGGKLLWGVIVETEAYCQSEPACHGHRRRSPSNETLFGEPGRFYVYVSYGIHHCVNVVTGRADWANGVLLRAAWLPGEPERIAAGPALLAKRFGLSKRYDAMAVDPDSGLWLAPRPTGFAEAFAEYLHERVRKELWAYASDEHLDTGALIAEAYQGIRPAPGYPACPEHTVKADMFRILEAEDIGMSLTESFAMFPGAAVSGFYFAHPESKYFTVGKIGEDQLLDMAQRRKVSAEQLQSWLAPNL